ncbi:MAG: nucleoside transporter C-terminal domain-containing protein, partial [Planctomycetota bacterium]
FFGANFVFFPQILGTIILVSTLMSILFYFGIMQVIVQCVAWVMMKTMGSSGAESLAASANIFVGQTEAPLVIGPYLKTMTKAELLSLMVGGMATIAGGVLVAYTFLGVSAGHLLAASVMSAPAAIICAKMLYPETGEPVTRGKVKLKVTIPDQNVIEAAARGCSDGLKLALNVMAMLIGFIACIEVLNIILSNITLPSGKPLNFQQIMAWIFYPFAWLMGISSKDLNDVAQLLGVKTVLNEFIAYLDMSRMKETMDPRNFIITTYALCGFANFSSIGIQIGGIGSLAEERRPELASLGMRALIGGTIASYMTACFAAILVESSETFYERAQERLNMGNWIGAMEDCNEAIAINPAYAEAYYCRAMARQKEGNFQESIADYTKALEINKDYINAYNSRGYVQAKNGNLKEAIADFSEALKRDAQNEEALYNRGIAHFNFGNKEDARKDCTQYLETTQKKKDSEIKKRRKAVLELFPELENKKKSSELED